jgi:hypothetical protein
MESQKMFKSKCNSHNLNAYVNLSIEALWLARAIQDALDILIGEPIKDSFFDRDRTKVLGISRDVFERLGAYGHNNGGEDSKGGVWSASSRTEFIRQVAVHWRAFIDSSFGMSCSSELIMSLTDYEISVLEQVLRLDKEIRTNKEGVIFCMSQELDAKSQHQSMLRALRCSSYLDSGQSRLG